MKKTIGIITFCDTLDNYGQVLQGYALQRYLRDNFSQHKIVFFYISPIVKKSNKIMKIYTKMKHIEQFIRIHFNAYILRRQKYIKKLKQKKLEWAMNEKITLLHKTREKDFNDFKKTYIALHKNELQEFKGYTDELYADCYIVGSDQIWNSSLIKDNSGHCLDFYTLNFLPKDNTSKKLAYAASIGKREFESEFEKAYFKEALAKFDDISLREAINIHTLSQIGIHSICVPDPSHLVSKTDYDKLINQSVESGQIHQTKSDGKVRKKSIFVYMLGNETNINKDKIMEFLHNHNENFYTNTHLNFLCKQDYENLFTPSPQEWLACVRDCKMIITDSFHGCAFAIVMNTPFVALKLSGGAEPRNVRFEQLFEIFGLHNRFIDNVDQLERVMNEPINWDSINKKLESWRDVGENFLAKNLNNL